MLQEGNEFFGSQLSAPENGPQSTGLYRLGAVHGDNGSPGKINLMAQDGMAAALTEEHETGFLEGTDNPLAGNMGKYGH